MRVVASAEGPVVQRAGGVDEAMHLFDRQHGGERSWARDVQLLEQRPVEGHDAAEPPGFTLALV
jgi:hypothetical protein